MKHALEFLQVQNDVVHSALRAEYSVPHISDHSSAKRDIILVIMSSLRLANPFASFSRTWT